MESADSESVDPMSDNDLFSLYSQEILGLAASIPLTDPLPTTTPPPITARKRSPLCGSTVTVALTLDADLISGFSQSVQACALGQASASIFGRQVIGCTQAQIARLCDELAQMLTGGPVPSAPFEGYQSLQAARDFPSRHASILLAPQATLAALVTGDTADTAATAATGDAAGQPR